MCIRDRYSTDKRDQNAAKQKVGDNHSIGEANESTHKSHTAQLTLSHHVAGLADACTAKKTDSSSALVKAGGRACLRRDGWRSRGASSPQKMAHESPGERIERVPAHENPGM